LWKVDKSGACEKSNKEELAVGEKNAGKPNKKNSLEEERGTKYLIHALAYKESKKNICVYPAKTARKGKRQ